LSASPALRRRRRGSAVWPFMSSTTTSNLLEAPSLPRSIFDYEVIDLIGDGAGSLIYAVNDPRTRQIYALKHVHRKSEKHACFIETAKALQALHRQGFVHCDLKPNNILLGPTGQVKVIDLGQACPVGTAKKRIQGTPDYIAPEQVKCIPVSVRTDVFNLGATL